MANATSASSLDEALAVLQARKDQWARLSIPHKITLLLTARANLQKAAQRWVDAAVRAKHIDPASPWVGEEWVTGPWAFAAGIDGYAETLHQLARDRPVRFGRVTRRSNGQLVLRVFPPDLFGWLLLNGLTADVWMQPGVTEANLREHVGAFYQRSNPEGRVALVLGAGNVNAIPPLDALYKLYADGQVVILKMNPVNDYLGPLLEDVLAPFIEAGYLRIVYGGADVGALLCQHQAVETIHLTGNVRSHDAIVFGTGADAADRRRRGQPLLAKPITSELGGVGPCIVVPGPWSKADFRFQAENVATMKLHNSGCNCVASQVLVLPREWDGSARLLDALREVMRSLPPRDAYYPGCAERLQAVLARHPDAERIGTGAVPRTLVTGLDPDDAEECCFKDEVFGPVLAQTSLPGATAAAFLENAVRFANERLEGTLGATLLVHPRTIRELGPRLDQAIADLRYGAIGVNVWNAAAFLLAQAPWGGHPGHRLDDIQSGIGVVHDTCLLDNTQKAVVRGSFYPFPRSWAHGTLAFLPKPPWFVTNRTAERTTRRVAHFAMAPGWRHLPGIFASALRG
jgi:aldehyde dehydrogenase (NAD(P)+)